MKKISLVFIIAIIYSALTSFGQRVPEGGLESPFIEVTGTAELLIIPDQIFINITLTEGHKGKSKVTIDQQEEKLKEALTKVGVDISKLSISDANAEYFRVGWAKKGVLTKRDYTLIVPNAKILLNVYQELDKLEIDEAHIAKVNHSKMDSLRKQVRISAIKSAKDKSDYLLNAIREKTGKATIIKEIEHPSVSNVNYMIRGARSNTTEYFVDGQKLKYDIQFQKIKLKSSIYVKFAIK